MTRITKPTTSSEDQQADLITLPRWVVYCQAMLLGLVATSCFIAGIFVGSFGKSSGPAETTTDFRVSGQIQFLHNDAWHPDAGAVVMLLPESPENISRQDPAAITPDLFQPLENPTIDSIRHAGGHIVRANLEGEFEFFATTGSYILLVVSNARKDERRQQLNREQVALLSQYFLPVENLIGRHEYFWQPVAISIKDIDVGTIKFE